MSLLVTNDGRLTIGQSARLSKVGVPTLRFYERAGLLPKPMRSASNYRLYPDEVIARIRFIRRAQQLGFTLKEIRDLLSLRASRRTSCAEVRSRAQVKIADIEERIRSLRQMSRALAKLAEECNVHSKTGDCPLLKHLESEFRSEES
jgi:MerR family mercuric resistance operon transcriptional regulator